MRNILIQVKAQARQLQSGRFRHLLMVLYGLSA